MAGSLDNPWVGLTPLSQAPFVAPGDEPFVASYNLACHHPAHRLQTGILPEPFSGDFARCKVLLLAGNPGYAQCNDDEHKDATFRSLTLANLHQVAGREYPLHFVSPDLQRFACHGWWTGRLRELMDAAGVHAVANHVSVVELFPYHSEKLNFRPELARLPSFGFTRSLVSAALARGAIPVVMRSRANWSTLLGADFPQQHLECSNPQRPYVSRGNLGGGFDSLVDALA